MLAHLAVLLGRTGAINSSVKEMLYDKPIIPFPKSFMNIYAILSPIVLRVIAFARERTKNKSHGTVVVEKPLKPCLISIVSVRLAIRREMSRTTQLWAISNIMLIMEETNIMSICQAFGERPDGIGTRNQTAAANNNTIKSLKSFIL